MTVEMEGQLLELLSRHMESHRKVMREMIELLRDQRTTHKEMLELMRLVRRDLSRRKEKP